MEENKLKIDCKHGKGIASVICCHQFNSTEPVGFIENCSDPNDLQAWCYACEDFFEQEGDMTEKFKKFSNAKIVCEKCYNDLKALHSID